MFCPNCGKEHLSDNGDICTYCGYEFNDIEFTLDESIQSVISEEIPSKLDEIKMSESAISEQIPDISKIIASAKIEKPIKATDNEIDIELPDISEASISEEIPNADFEDEKLPDYTISEEIPDIEELVVDADKEIKESVVLDIASNESDIIKDEPQSNNVFFESSISEEIPSVSSEDKSLPEYTITEEIPATNIVNENLNKNPFDESYAKAKASISSNQKDRPAASEAKNAKEDQNIPSDANKTPEKKKSSNFLLIIVLLGIGIALIYFGMQYIQNGNNIFSGSTEKPQTTATQVSVKSSANSANIVETEINGKKYYSLIVNGEKGSVITVNDKNTFNLAGISISIPINVSDYITSPSQTEASIVIKVKIVGPDKVETLIDVPPYTVKVQPDTESTAPVK